MNISAIALVPARGGSKGIPKKNLAIVGGKPLIAWTIEAALSSHKCERVITSTDDAEIADVARRYGSDVPFLRPLELARDETPSIDVALHALSTLRVLEGRRAEWLILLQPTSPLRTAVDIDEAVALAHRKGADAVVSVSPVSEHPYWLKRIDESGRLLDFLPSGAHSTRRQDLPPLYSPNGAVYVVRCDVLFQQRTFTPENTYGYVMPGERSIDIDTEFDLKIAECLLSDRKKTHEPR